MTQNSLVLTTHLQLTSNITKMTHDDSDVSDKKYLVELQEIWYIVGLELNESGDEMFTT